MEIFRKLLRICIHIYLLTFISCDNETEKVFETTNESIELVANVTEASPNDTVVEFDPKYSSNYEDLYKEAVKQYLDENWSECASFMQGALKDYKWHTSTLIK